MTRYPIAVFCSSLFLGALAAPAAAQPGAPPPNYAAPPTYGQAGSYPAVGVVPRLPGYQTHDGFYLNLQLGPGYTSMSASAGGTDVTISGGGAAFSLALGGAVAPNLILFGQVLADSSVDPKVKVGALSANADGSVTVAGFGAGLAYYVMPANVFLLGSALATQ